MRVAVLLTLLAFGYAQTMMQPQATCVDVKQAYKAAQCCGASDATTRKVEGFAKGVSRPGCNSRTSENTTVLANAGGTLYSYATTASGTKQWKTLPNGNQYVDLAESAIAAGCTPKHKPHMVVPAPNGNYTIITYTGDTDIHVIENSAYAVRFCVSMEYKKPSVFGGATHDGAWFGNDAFLVVDMTGCYNGVCGGAIHKISFTYSSGVMTAATFAATLGFNGVATSRGSTTGNSKPIAMGTNNLGAYSNLFFVTDAKASGSILNATDMTWVKHFNITGFGTCSGGGLWVVPDPTDERIVTAVYGKQDGASCTFKINLMTQTMTLLAQHSANIDLHSLNFCNTTNGTMTVITTGRQTSTIDVINYQTGVFAVQDWDMNTNLFDTKTVPYGVQATGGRRSGPSFPQGTTSKLQPDVVYLHDGFLYIAARGPSPVSAVKAQNYLPNARPGLFAVKIDMATCTPAADQSDAFGIACFERSPAITSDVHGAWGVDVNGNKEIWAVDQAGTGSVQQYKVYSTCASYGTTSVHNNPATLSTSRL